MNALTAEERASVSQQLFLLAQDIRNGVFTPNVVYENKQPAEYAATRLTSYGEGQMREFQNISELLEYYYAEKNVITRIRQRSVDLRRIVQTALERNVKKI